jgi:hypothetical protein
VWLLKKGGTLLITAVHCLEDLAVVAQSKGWNAQNPAIYTGSIQQGDAFSHVLLTEVA